MMAGTKRKTALRGAAEWGINMAIEITDFNPFVKDGSSLRGFMVLRMTAIGLGISGVCLHEKNGKRWLQLPSKPFPKKDGGAGWTPIVDFYDKARKAQFQAAALAALDAFLAKGKGGTDGF